MTILAVAAFWIFSALLSLLSREDRGYSRTPLFRAAGTAGFLALLGWSATTVAIPRGNPYHAFFTVPAFFLVTIIGTALAFRFWSSLIGDFFMRARSVMMGDDRMTVEKSFDRAHKAEKEGDLEGAYRLYAEERAKDPAAPEPLRRMAEIRLQQGRAEEALSHLRDALPLAPSPEERAVLSFRISDLLLRLGRTQEARSELESTARELAGTRFEKYARERLAGIGGETAP